ncbi:MAG: SDR family NAD(P)-dependent oxidoreductase [Oscillospiraceae bacterium]|nr:SDR family NAD(P)-dependent oxidoreductase [Oscillospiraceae bacterium]
MDKKTIIITGASSGIGKAAAKLLKEKGHEVVIVGRSPERTKAVGEELGVDYYIADFTKLNDVRELGQKLHDKYPRIDVLINNAGGIYRDKREVTVDGNERTFQTCHLAHFLLTNILLDTLIESKASIINTSSVGAAGLSKLDIHDLNLEKKYANTIAYGNAKLEVTLFAKEFNRRYGKLGVNMVSFHPGNVLTNFASEADGFIHSMYSLALKSKIMQALFAMIGPEEGADTLVWLATTEPGKDWQPGNYYYKRKIARTHKLADDPATAKSLWEQSEKLCGVTYPVL